MILLAIVILWLISALLVAGWNFAYVQSTWPCIAEKNYRSDFCYAMVCGAVFGPLGIPVALLMTGFAKHGWRLRYGENTPLLCRACCSRVSP